MAHKVNVHEAKTNLSQLLDRAHAGEEIVIAKAGTPYARLVPLEVPPPRKPGLLKGKLGAAFFEPLPEGELDAWEP
jgi:prevent-host-death family protein